MVTSRSLKTTTGHTTATKICRHRPATVKENYSTRYSETGGVGEKDC